MSYKLQEKLKVLIVFDQNSEIESILLNVFSDSSGFIEILHANSVETAIETVVLTAPHVTFVFDAGTGTCTRELLVGLDITGFNNELGVYNSIVAVVDPQNVGIEGELVALGGKGVIPYDVHFPEILRYVIRFAVDLKHIINSLRADKDDLIRQLFDMHDNRERESELGNEYIGLSDEFSLVRSGLERAVQDKYKIFSIIAHDLRAPFLPLLAYTELLSTKARDLSTEKVEEYAANAHEAGRNVYCLLENLLDWSMIQMGCLKCKPEITDIDDVVKDVWDILEPVAKNKDIKLIRQINSKKVYLDSNMISTVLRNLLSNAIKFSYKGTQINLEVSDSAGEKNELLEIRVIDHGIGMSAEKASALFSQDEVMKTTGTNGEFGSGLGLSLCKELVERNGGKISASSEPGKGSVFTFTLRTTPF